MSLVELAELCPPPSVPYNHYSPEREREVTAQLNLQFPRDYIEFCNNYGYGAFVAPDTHEIFIANVFEESFEWSRHNIQDAIDECFSYSDMKEPLDRLGVDVCSLFPLASDTDTTCLAWVTHEHSDKWRVLSFEYEDQIVELFEMGLTDFLAGYFSGRLYVGGWAHRMKSGKLQKYTFIPYQERGRSQQSVD